MSLSKTHLLPKVLVKTQEELVPSRHDWVVKPENKTKTYSESVMFFPYVLLDCCGSISHMTWQY